MNYDNIFTKPEKPFLLLQVLNNELCVDWFDNEDDLKEHALYYLSTYNDNYVVRDAIEIGSCREIEIKSKQQYSEEFEKAYEEYNKEVDGVKDQVSKEDYFNNEWQEELDSMQSNEQLV